jgi:Ribbon-helix-helix protein, copG family
LLIYIHQRIETGEVISMARMTRTIISISEDEKKWLEAHGRRRGVSSAEVVRRAIREYREKESQTSLPGVLRETAGTWTSIKGDTVEHVRRLRREWERKS